MQQRQPRLGDILDDYCPRERRVTNHAVVAMIGDDVKQTRCTTCDADHEYKHAKVPRQRRKETPAVLYSQVAAGAPKRVAHEATTSPAEPAEPSPEDQRDDTSVAPVTNAGNEPGEAMAASASEADREDDAEGAEPAEESGDTFESVHRPLIRATLPKHEGQQALQRQAPDFTIRQPSSRPGSGRFRPRNQRPGGGQPFGNGGRSNAGGSGNHGQSMRGGVPRPHNGGGRPQDNGGGNPSRPGRNQGPRPGGGKRSR
jgi:hypothetical protein